ncbi:MAG: hypothetical protein KFF73_17440 [Cyclobacteriaceae bacterium]|nr:hypothetical protein [Cyclobacteriaceae bacterium]
MKGADVIKKWKLRRVEVFVFFSGIVLMLFSWCASTDVAYTPRKHMKYYRETYSPSVQRADDIQYRSAYKYDLKGKKYKKHFKKQNKRKRNR